MASISDAIKKDHREIEEYYNNILRASDDDSKTRWQNQFVWELARHSISEELVVYPAMEKNLGPKGKEMAEKDRAEHQIVSCQTPHIFRQKIGDSTDASQVKEKLYAFQKLNASSPDFLQTIKSLMEDLSKHIKEEEEDDLPILEKTLNSSDSESMARSFGRTKAFVPSRSHPSAPNKPPFETVAGLMAAPIDRLADMFRKFPDETTRK